MRDFIRKRLRERIDIPSFKLPQNVPLTEEDVNKIKTLTWSEIMLDDNENSGGLIYIDVTFADPILNKLSDAIVFSIQLIKGEYYHPHLLLAQNIQGLGIGPKILKAFVMDFGHIYASKGRTQNPRDVGVVMGKLGDDPEMERFDGHTGTVIISKNNPDRDAILKGLGLELPRRS